MYNHVFKTAYLQITQSDVSFVNLCFVHRNEAIKKLVLKV